MNELINGFCGYLYAEDIHGQIALCKNAGKKGLCLKNLNFNYACNYNENQAKEVKKILAREGVYAVSLWVGETSLPEDYVKLAGVYEVEYIVTSSEDMKEKLLKLCSDKYKVFTEKEVPLCK